MRTFHDHFLTGVSVDETGVVLRVKSDGRWIIKEQYRIIVKGLVRLRSDNFLQGNIIDSVVCHDIRNARIDEDDIRACARFALDEPESDPHSSISQIVNRMLAGELMALEVIPSYGAYLVAIGRMVTVESDSMA